MKSLSEGITVRFGECYTVMYDAVTMQSLDSIMRDEGADGRMGVHSFDVKAGGSIGLRWELVIPEGVQAISYKLTAQAGTHVDGEEKTIPVLTNSLLITEALPFSVRAGKVKSLTFAKRKLTAVR